MATGRWSIIIRDAGETPRTGLTVTLRDPSTLEILYTLTESFTKLGQYYADVDDGLYKIYIDDVNQPELSGSTGRWIGGPDVA